MRGALTAAAAALALGACGAEVGPTVDVQPLTAVCVGATALAPEGALFCGETQSVECDSPRGVVAPTVYFVPPRGACGDWWLASSSNPQRLSLGTHTLETSATSRDAAESRACRATAVVLDTRPPRVATRVVTLWPPNHRFHRVTPADCVQATDACDAAPRVVFTWAASDEAPDATGEGRTAVDIQGLGCDGVELRAERRGNGDGRVYTLGVRAFDHSGNATDVACTVVVPHDASGRAPAAGVQAWRIPAPDGCVP